MPCDDSDGHDAMLVRRTLDGSGAAFTGLFERYYARIRAHAYRMVLDVHLADDVAQETFIRAASNLACLRETEAFAAWIFRIAGNIAKDKLRSQTAYAARLEAFANDPCEPSSPATAETVETARIHAAIRKLPPKQREAVSLVWFENNTHAEAAGVLGCAESTVSWRLALAKRQLRKLLAP